MRRRLNGFPFILHPSAFILSSPPSAFILCLSPRDARELAERPRAAHFVGEGWYVMLPKRLDLAAERVEPRRLHRDTRAAEGAARVLVLDAVDDQISAGARA